MSKIINSLKEAKLAVDLGRYSPEAEKISQQLAQEISDREAKKNKPKN